MATPAPAAVRPRIAFFDYPDVFEDFYRNYGITKEEFATKWANSGNHAFLEQIQRKVGDVTWYEFTVWPSYEGGTHEVTGCEIRFIPSSAVHRWLWERFYLPKLAWIWRGAYGLFAAPASYVSLLSVSFLRSLRRTPPDIIFVQDYATGRFDVLVALARLLRRPLIAYHAGSRPEGYLGKLAKYWTIRRADHLIVSSQREAKMLERRYGVPAAKMTVVLVPIDIEGYRPLDRRRACLQEDLDANRRYILFLGRLQDPVKRVSAIIRAFASVADQFTDADLLIVGDGPDTAALQQQAAKAAPGRIHFRGWVSGMEQKARLYSAAQFLVLASRSEGFPTVVGEAMACGTPVLASDVGGISELVVDGSTGWLVPPGDDEALGRAMGRALSDPHELVRMRAKARKTAEERVSGHAVGEALRRCFQAVGR